MTEVAKPKSILRGHNAQVHAAVFIRRNERLATGDAEGFVILWDLTIVRPRAVWRAHENAILGIAGWGNDKLITYVSIWSICHALFLPARRGCCRIELTRMASCQPWP